MTYSEPTRSLRGPTSSRSEFARRHFVTRVTLAASLGAGFVAGMVGLLSSSGADKPTLKGTLTVTLQAAAGAPCSPVPAYPDLADGAPIVVSNVAGVQVAVGQLGIGQVEGVSCVRSLNIGAIAKLDEYRLLVGANSAFVVSAEALQLSKGVIDLRFGD